MVDNLAPALPQFPLEARQLIERTLMIEHQHATGHPQRQRVQILSGHRGRTHPLACLFIILRHFFF
jgi:hypothetical protein